MTHRDAPPPDDETIMLEADAEAQERDEAVTVSRLGLYAVPVGIAHLALLWVVLRAAFGIRLPQIVHGGQLLAWLWVNGAALALGFWFWRKGRVPVTAGRWLKGRRAKRAILLWLGLSLAWFLLPALLGHAWRLLTAGAGGY